MNKSLNKNLKNRLVGILLLVIAGVLFFGRQTYAVEILNAVLHPLNTTVMLVVGTLAQILVTVIGAVISVVIYAVIHVANYNNFINETSIIGAWVIVRDFCNMFFILVLLVIAFATILRLPSYEWKKLLPKLLIMAVLINFSRTICGLIIDVTQIIMLTFINAIGDAGGNYINTLGVQKYLSVNWEKSWGGDLNLTSTVMGLILGVMFLVIAAVVMIAFLGVLIMRIVMLWVYIVLSPLAFLLSAFPQGQTFAKQWWSDFIANAISGPILAFFLWLSLISAGQISSIGSGGIGAGSCFGPSQILCPNEFINFVVAIGMLIGGLVITQKAGGMAGDAAGKGLDWAKKVSLAPAKASARLAGWGGKRLGTLAEQKLEEHGFSALTRGYWKGFGARRERLQAESSNRAMGKGEQLAEERWHPKFWQKRKGAMNKVEEKRMEVINKIESDIQKNMGSSADPRQEMQHQAKLAFESEGIEGEQRREAIIQMATRKGNLDDVYFSMMPQLIQKVDAGKMSEKDFADKYKMSEKDAKAHMSVEDNKMEEKDFKNRFGMDTERAKTYNAASARRFLAGYLDLKQDWVNSVEMDDATAKGSEEGQKTWNAGARIKVEELTKKSDQKEQNKLRTMASASEVAKGVGHWEQFTTVKDDKTGKYKLLTDLDNFDEVLGEFRKRSVSENLNHTATHTMRGTHLDDEGEWNRSPRTQDQGFFEKNFWKQGFTGQFVRDIHRAQTRMAPHMIGKYFDEQSGAMITDDEEAKKRGFKDAAELKEAAEDMRAGNQQIFDALYKLLYYGRGDIDDVKGPVPDIHNPNPTFDARPFRTKQKTKRDRDDDE